MVEGCYVLLCLFLLRFKVCSSFLFDAVLSCCSALNWEPDEEGINGMVITKTLPSEAAKVNPGV